MYKRDIYLDIDDKLNEHIKSVELDSNSRVWHFHLTVDYQPLNLTGKTVKFMAEKPDKTNVLNDCKIIDAENGIVKVELTRQVNAVPGHVNCLLKIVGSDGYVLKTKTFIVEVSKTLSDKPIVSTNEFSALDEALGRVQNIDQRFAETNAQLSQVENLTFEVDENINNLHINVKFPPPNSGLTACVGDGSDETEKIQAFLNYVAENKGGTLFFPKGNYGITNLKLKNRVSIKGSGIAITSFIALESSYLSLIEIGDAPIQQTNYSDFSISGKSLNNNQHGLDLTAIEQTMPAYTGGVWYCNFENIHISGFNGHQLRLVAENKRGDLANQFLNFKNILAFRNSNTNSRSLYIEGQLGQTKFINCEFDGRDHNDGTLNVEIKSITNGQDEIACLEFDTCTFQEADLAVRLRYTFNVKFQNCWFENLNNAINVYDSGFCTVSCSHFANAARTGSLFYLGVAGSMVVENSHALGTYVKVVEGSDGHSGIRMINNYGMGSTGESKYTGTTRQLSAPQGVLTSYYCSHVLLSGTSTLTRIVSQIGLCEELTIISWQDNLKINKTGNIYFSGNTITLNQWDTITLRKWEHVGSVIFVVVGTTGTITS